MISPGLEFRHPCSQEFRLPPSLAHSVRWRATSSHRDDDSPPLEGLPQPGVASYSFFSRRSPWLSVLAPRASRESRGTHPLASLSLPHPAASLPIRRLSWGCSKGHGEERLQLRVTSRLLVVAGFFIFTSLAYLMPLLPSDGYMDSPQPHDAEGSAPPTHSSSASLSPPNKRRRTTTNTGDCCRTCRLRKVRKRLLLPSHGRCMAHGVIDIYLCLTLVHLSTILVVVRHLSIALYPAEN